MKSKVIKGEVENDFPKLMEAESGRVVLFIADGIGTTIGGVGDLGSYYNDWSMDVFKPFHGEVILTEN